MAEILNRIGLIVFCSNTRNLTVETTKCILDAASELRETEIVVIFVNDGSTDDTEEFIKESIRELFDSKYKIIGYSIKHSAREGLSKSMLTGIEKLIEIGFHDNDFITQLPGNNQLTSPSISKLIASSSSNHLTIGWRVNIESRPYPKRVFSRILQLVIHIFFFRGIKQVTANYVSTIKLAKDWIKPNAGHAFGIWLIHGAVQEKLAIVQVPLTLHPEIKLRPTGNSIRRWPRIMDVNVMLINLIRVYLYKVK